MEGEEPLDIFAEMNEYNYEQLVFCHDDCSGLRAIIAIHDTTLGPALGGVRMWPYKTEAEAVKDVLRLARGMTYKNAAAGLNLGGGKAVIIGDPQKDKSEALFRAFGRFIQGLNGRYITAEDVGTTEADMDFIYQETDYVTGVSPVFGSGGDPSPSTAYGVYRGMKAAAEVAFGNDSLTGKTVAVQGLGKVAVNLCNYLHEEGAKLVVTDINEERVRYAVEHFNAEAVGVNDIYDVPCDIFSPNALGGVINDDTVSRLKCRVVAGAANNQLLAPRHGDALAKTQIAYVPDYIINAGGVIHVADELIGFNRERVRKKVENIYNTVINVFKIAEREGIASYQAADRLAEERIRAVHRVHSVFVPNEKHV